MPSQITDVSAVDLTPDKGEGHRIGVFDSGLGGLSVLQALRARLPHAEMLYVADSGHAPYGEKDVAHITARSLHISRFLLGQGADAIVVACNTATAAAVHALRAQWPHVPIIGVEPGVKPAVKQSPGKCIGVLATPGTLASEKFRQLVARHVHEARITLQACPGLAKEIETGVLDSPRLRELVTVFSAPLKEAGVDTVVLGCTHYPFVRALFSHAFGEHVSIIDTAEAVARQVARQLNGTPSNDNSLSPPHKGETRLWSSGDPKHLSETVHRWLGLRAEARPLP
ncbi:MAG: glutamate racemase [Aquabacterium sp.]|uniref:glutamate racemase n=1 Tax=Aquabacterium sp. TaxID=1872578 RepID=UPI003BDF031A